MKYLIFIFSITLLAGSSKPLKKECVMTPNPLRCAESTNPKFDEKSCQWSCQKIDISKKKCLIWHDGCNDCMRTHPKQPFRCTKKACFRTGPEYCKRAFKIKDY